MKKTDMEAVTRSMTIRVATWWAVSAIFTLLTAMRRNWMWGETETVG